MNYVRNLALTQPIMILACSTLSPLSHQLAGRVAVAAILVSFVIAAWPKLDAFINRNKRWTYFISAFAWLLGVIFVARFVWKVIH